MIRYTVFMAISLSLVVAITVWFSDRPGQVAIEWQGWLIQLSVAQFILGCLILFVTFFIFFRLIRLIVGVPTRLRSKRQNSRRERGYKALTRGMVAVAAGDPDEAGRQARRADVFLNEPPLTMLLSAQAAQLNGDEAAAEKYFTNMLNEPETAFLGIRGLMIQAQRKKDQPAVLKYLEQAYHLQPKTPWVLTNMFDLQVSERKWQEALATLELLLKYADLPTEDARERRTLILLGCSGEAADAGNELLAVSYAKRALSISPDFLPAAILSADLMLRTGKSSQAKRIVGKVWKISPHPDLANLYSRIDESNKPLEKVKRVGRLLELNPNNVESHLAFARAALDAELWGEARGHLETAIEINATVRVYRLLADLEERSGAGSDPASKWLLRAATAAPDQAWVCDACAAVWKSWLPVCNNCDGLGTIGWHTPGTVEDISIKPETAELGYQ
ncbi:MAG: heme biosynthesis HemY N-terminal domain-containing protein [Pseudomonadota bacterium]|nr:heme biosynthesis HemY N-terminal domain-containing protein [Pseudomonadota bacterium]